MIVEWRSDEQQSHGGCCFFPHFFFPPLQLPVFSFVSLDNLPTIFVLFFMIVNCHCMFRVCCTIYIYFYLKFLWLVSAACKFSFTLLFFFCSLILILILILPLGELMKKKKNNNNNNNYKFVNIDAKRSSPSQKCKSSLLTHSLTHLANQ